MIRAVAVRAALIACGWFVAMLAIGAILSALPGFNVGADPNVRYYPVMDVRAHHLVPSPAP